MTTNRRAEEFEQALAAKGHVDPTMAALVAVAGALTAIPKPRAAFRESLRTQLMAEAASMAAAASVPAAAAAVPAAAPAASGAMSGLRTLFAHPAMQAATGTLAATVAATGVGIGASRSLPGDALYGLKQTVERWQVGLAGGAVDEANALVEHAATRLAEVRALLADGASADKVRAALADLADELDSATSRLLAAARDGSREAYDSLMAAVTDLNAQIKALLPLLPPEARAVASEAMRTLNVAKAQLLTLPVPSGPGPGVPTPTTPTDVPTPHVSPTVPTPTVTTPAVPTPEVPTPSVPTPTVPVPTVPVPTPTAPVPTVPVPSVPVPSVTVPPVLPITLPPV